MAKCVWNDTELSDNITKYSMKASEIKQLLINRGESSQNCNKKNKSQLIKFLKSKYSVQLSKPLIYLTAKGLEAECKLRKVDCKGKKVVLMSRLLGKPIDEKHIFWQKIDGPMSDSFSHPVKLNKNEFAVIKQQPYSSDYCNSSQYNIIERKWRYIKPEPIEDQWSYVDTSVCLDDTANILYGFSRDISYGTLYALNLNNNKINKWKNTADISDGYRMMHVHKQLHLIGGWSKHHYIFNEETNKFDIIQHVFDKEMTHFGLVKVSSRDIVLAVGGSEGFSPRDLILCYNVLTKKWSELGVKLPTKLHKAACAVTGCERYVIILGGQTKYNKGVTDSIYILDLLTMEMRASIISCPRKSYRFRAIIMDNERARNCIVFGFVRGLWKKEEYKLMRYPPDYIIRLILSWFMYESLHLLDNSINYGYSGRDNDHWIIDVDHVINLSQSL